MRLLLFACVLLLAPQTTFAQLGMSLAWDDCSLGAPNLNLASDCLDTGLPHKLVVTVGGVGVVDQVIGAEVLIEVLTDSPDLPDFWHLEAGGCRAAKLSADITIGSSSPPYSCPEPWSPNLGGPGGQAGGVTFEPFVGGPNRGRITGIIGVQGEATLDFDAVAPDWYIMAINMFKAGSSTCGGCTVPVCLIGQQVRLYRTIGAPGGDVFVGDVNWSEVATWHGGGTLTCYTPTKNKTWGQVKSLYR